jgi:predicted AlkP superfamily pyrophosphatase or phosphodiesterase
MREGVYAEAVEGVYPSLTYPSHTSIATGARPATHGILNNTLFDPLGRSSDWYWYDEAIEVPALWDAAKEAGGATGAVSWPVTVRADIEYNLPEYWRNAPYSWRELLSGEMSPAFLKAVETELGTIPDDPYEGARLESFTFDVAGLIVRKFRPQLLLFHVFQTDGVQHTYGREHVEVAKAFEETDRKLHRFMNTLESSGLADRTLVVVTGDHGFIQVHTVVNINVVFRENGLITLNADGTVSDWKAMAWPSGGSCAIMLHESADDEVRNKVEDLVDELLAGPLGSAIYRVPKEQLRRLGAMPEAAFALEGRPGYIFGGGLRGDLLAPSGSLGYHGFLPDKPGMKTGFLMVGPGVRAGIRIPEMKLIDIAPTIAEWAGWKMPQAEGLSLRGLFEESKLLNTY